MVVRYVVKLDSKRRSVVACGISLLCSVIYNLTTYSIGVSCQLRCSVVFGSMLVWYYVDVFFNMRSSLTLPTRQYEVLHRWSASHSGQSDVLSGFATSSEISLLDIYAGRVQMNDVYLCLYSSVV